MMFTLLSVEPYVSILLILITLFFFYRGAIKNLCISYLSRLLFAGVTAGVLALDAYVAGVHFCNQGSPPVLLDLAFGVFGAGAAFGSAAKHKAFASISVVAMFLVMLAARMVPGGPRTDVSFGEKHRKSRICQRRVLAYIHLWAAPAWPILELMKGLCNKALLPRTGATSFGR